MCAGLDGVQPTNVWAGGVKEAESDHTEPEVSVCVAHTADAAACDSTVGVQPSEQLS